jgi:hypothetical protein
MPDMTIRRSAALLLLAGGLAAGDAPLQVLEPSGPAPAQARKPERARWSWNQPMAEVVPTGDLAWKPEPFKLETGKTVRSIDFDGGSDDNDGTREKPWKHHPWDPAATGKAKAHSGPTTYVFKRGVVYRGELHPTESGAEGDPIRLTSDPAWGSGEAVISGAEPVAKWTKGADRADIADADKVWWADLPFSPRCVWAKAGERVELARSPNWTVSDPDEAKSEWWKLQNPKWWENNCTACMIDFNGLYGSKRAHIGIDAANLTHDASWYVGAIAHVEYGWVMGTPIPTRVEAFDAERKGIIFQGIWLGDSEHITTGMHYFLEDKPQYLDAPGEFWFDRKDNGGSGRLYLRMPGDADPNAAGVEVARHINLIESGGLEHVAISGLTFTHTNQTWDITVPPWMDPNIDNAAIRVRGGAATDLRIANCRFVGVGKAVLIDAATYDRASKPQPCDRIVIADNDIDQTDHGAMTLNCHGHGDVKVLRNHLHLIGLRTFRQDHSHALVVTYPETMEIAGNILERTTGSGIFVFGGKASGDAGEVALARTLIHHNKAIDTLLSANDWGGIETWQSGPFYNYCNISAKPNGMGAGHDPTKPGSARGASYAFYHDGGFKNYDFNQICYGASDDWTSKLSGGGGYFEATSTVENWLFNCTIAKFTFGSMWSPAGARHFFLGNVFDSMGITFFHHGALKEDKDQTKHPYPHDGTAYGRNVFSRLNASGHFAEFDGKDRTSVEDMRSAFADNHGLVDDIGVLAPESPLRDTAKNDFRPKPGSPAIDGGVRMFVPWGLARTVGEWHFRRHVADPTIVLDEHWYMMPYYINRDSYHQIRVNNLTGHGIAAGDFIQAPLEDWTDAALKLDGKDQYLELSHAEATKPIEYQVGNEKRTAAGKDISTPDIHDSSLIVEAYVQAKTPNTALVSKLTDAAGYRLAINKAGGATLTVVSGGAKSEVASGAVLTDGKWHHVLAELDRDAGKLAIYTDGKKTAEAKCVLPAGASLANDADFLVGRDAGGHAFAGAIEFLRVARASLAESKTSIEELYDWEFDGPFLRDFAGREPVGKGRDAGALEADK